MLLFGRTQLVALSTLLILSGCQTAHRQNLPNFGRSTDPPAAESLADRPPTTNSVAAHPTSLHDAAAVAIPTEPPVSPAGYQTTRYQPTSQPAYPTQVSPTSWLAMPQSSRTSKSTSSCSYG